MRFWKSVLIGDSPSTAMNSSAVKLPGRKKSAEFSDELRIALWVLLLQSLNRWGISSSPLKPAQKTTAQNLPTDYQITARLHALKTDPLLGFFLYGTVPKLDWKIKIPLWIQPFLYWQAWLKFSHQGIIGIVRSHCEDPGSLLTHPDFMECCKVLLPYVATTSLIIVFLDTILHQLVYFYKLLDCGITCGSTF